MNPPDFPLLEATLGPALVFGADLVVIAVNRAWLALTSTQEDAWLGRPVEALTPTLQRVRDQRQPVTLAVQRHDWEDERGLLRERFFRPTSSPVLDSAGNVRWVLHRLEDVTERQQLALQLETAQRREALARQAGEIAHELNNLFTVILSHNALLLRREPEGDAREILEELSEVSDRAAQLVHRLLVASRGAQTPAPSPPVKNAQAAPTGRETVLLVEDDARVRAVVRRMLERLGYGVLEAGSGQQAFALAARHAEQVDVLLSDLSMPEHNGREVAERLRVLLPGLKVLFMSGYDDPAILGTGLLAPGDAFLQKPIDPDVLARKLRQVLDAPPRPTGAPTRPAPRPSTHR